MSRHRLAGRRTVLRQRSPWPRLARACCACCGNYTDDPKCVSCSSSTPSANVGEASTETPSSSSQDGAKAAGIGAGVVLVALAVLLSQQERLFS